MDHGYGSQPATPRYGEPVLVPPRLGQNTFRIAVTDACGAPLHLPRDPRDHPDPAKLEWHARELFRDSA